MTTAPQYTALTDHVCIEARGRDAGAFLHGQLSQVVADLDASRAPLAAWHDAKGRVRALFRVVRLPERWLLVSPRDGVEPLLKKLKMFVLRAAVTLDVSNDVAVAAVLDVDDAWLRSVGALADTRPNRVIASGDIRFAHIGGAYWQALGAPAALASLAASLRPAQLETAALAEIRLGIPAITAGLAERFVAQMLNLDELGAVSFDKGCYPGQEIVARLNNLGGVKRRARRYASGEAPPAVGTAIVTADGVEVGEVVRSTAAGSGSELLAVVDNAAVDAPLAAGGASLRALALPFPVPRD